MKTYKTPPEYFYRCAFPRGRLLSKLEDDITIFANIFISNTNKPEKIFISNFVRDYKKIKNLDDKTIQNHRTEMNKLWGMTYIDNDGFVQSSNRILVLVQTQDFRLFFKSFCNKFQFPNGINKSRETIEKLSKKILFKPAKFILEILLLAEKKYGSGFFIKGSEISNLIFNDVRVTTGNITSDEVLNKIVELRKDKIICDAGSYFNQHGREFLEYMFLAGLLLKDKTGNFKINIGEKSAIDLIINNTTYFEFPLDYANSLEVRNQTQKKWDLWFGEVSSDERVTLVTPNSVYETVLEKEDITIEKDFKTPNQELLIEIGDIGEQIVLKFEIEVIKKIRPDKLSLIKRVSNDTSLGFDIQSLEPSNINERKYIEVKTTKRTFFPSQDIFTYFPMSSNEWETARNHGEKYYIYRVFLTTEGYKIFCVKNPIKLEKEGHIIIEPLQYRVILKKNSGNFFTEPISEVNS